MSSDQQQLGDRWFQVVCYDTDSRRSLADFIDDDRPVRRTEAAAAALRALPGWRESAGHGMMALPADIVLAHRPLLLPLPGWGPPPLRRLLGEPERIAHLTPEEARGVAPGKRPPDLHALSVAALRCFETLPDIDSGRLLQRAACGAVFAHRSKDSRLPAWMHRIEPVQAVLEQLTALTGSEDSEPAPLDPRYLAVALDTARRAMDPVAAIQSLRETKDPRRAIGLAQTVLDKEPNYKLLLLVADIADKDLDDPFEAWSLLDRAVELDPAPAEANLELLRIIGSLWPIGERMRAGSADPAFLSRIHQMVHAAFDRLPPGSRREHAHEVTRYLIGLGRPGEANDFAYRWLHDGVTLMWWSFPLMLDYAETFALLGRPLEARQVLDQIRDGFSRALEMGQVTRREIHQHGLRLSEIERALLEADEDGTEK